MEVYHHTQVMDRTELEGWNTVMKHIDDERDPLYASGVMVDGPAHIQPSMRRFRRSWKVHDHFPFSSCKTKFDIHVRNGSMSFSCIEVVS